MFCVNSFVCRHSQLWRRDSNVCFVDSDTLSLLGSGVLEDVTFVRGRIPESCIVDGGNVEVLSDICDPGWYAFDSFAGGSDHGELY